MKNSLKAHTSRAVRALAAVVLASAALVSCGPKTVISGKVEDADKIIFKALNVNHPTVLDTVLVKDGSFTYKLDIVEGQPEFIQLFFGERQLGTLLVCPGDNIRIESDTLIMYKVMGSDETLSFQQVEKSYNRFMREMVALEASDAPVRVINDTYVKYYRECVNYVMSHSKSLTTVPVLSQDLPSGLPVFSRNSDAILFRMICDSLRTVYPESAYLKALEAETLRRTREMELGIMVENASEAGFPDIELPGIDGAKVRLSDVAASSKVVMLYFWTAAPELAMFNLEALKPLYDEFHSKGFDIYQVSFDVDKSAWASVVRSQKLPWASVCDIRGIESPIFPLYGLGALPMVYFIVDGDLDPSARAYDLDTFRAYLRGKLK